MQQKIDYFCELYLQYDASKLREEVDMLYLEPYFKDNPNTDSWFAGPETWLYADIQNKPNTEVDSIHKQLKELLGTNNVVFAVMLQKANTEVPVHNDILPKRILDMYPDMDPIQCSVNIQLNDSVGPINFPSLGSLETYKCALLNILEDHGVPAFDSDRYFVKFKILDISYTKAFENYSQSIKLGRTCTLN